MLAVQGAKWNCQVGNNNTNISLVPTLGGPAIDVSMMDCCDIDNAITISSDTGEMWIALAQNLTSMTNYSVVWP